MDSFRNFWGSPSAAGPPTNPPTARVGDASDEELDDRDTRTEAVPIRALPTEDGVPLRGLRVGSPYSTGSFEDALERDANSSQVSYGSAGPFTPLGSYTAPSVTASETGLSSSQYGFLVDGAMHRLNQLADKEEGDTSLLQNCDEEEFQARIAKIAEENGVTLESPSISSLVETLLPVVQEISRQTTPATTPGRSTPLPNEDTSLSSPLIRLSVRNAEEREASSPGLRVVTEDRSGAHAPVVSASTMDNVREAAVTSASVVDDVTPPRAPVSDEEEQPEEEDSGDYVEVENEEVGAGDGTPDSREEEEQKQSAMEEIDESSAMEMIDESEVDKPIRASSFTGLEPTPLPSENIPSAEENRPAPEKPIKSSSFTGLEPTPLPADTRPPAVEKRPPAEEKRPPAEEKRPPAEEKKPPAGEKKPAVEPIKSSSFTGLEPTPLVVQKSLPAAGKTISAAAKSPPAAEEERKPVVAEEKRKPAEVPVQRVIFTRGAWDEDMDASKDEPAAKEVIPKPVEAPVQVVEVEESPALEDEGLDRSRLAEPEIQEHQPPRATLTAAPAEEKEEEEEEEFHEGEEIEDGEEGEYEEYEEEGEEYEEGDEEGMDFEELAAAAQLSPEIVAAIQQAQQQAAAAAAAQQGQNPQPPAGLGSGGAGLGSRPGLGSGPAGLGSGGAGLGSGPAGLGSGGAGLGPALPPRPAAGVVSRNVQSRGEEVAATPEEEEELNDEQKEVKAKARALRLKLLRLALRVGHSHRSGIVAQVLYRIELAEQRQLGRGMLNRTGMNFDSIAAVAAEQEAKEGSDAPLDLHIKLLFLGKTGVGKSATINNLLQQPLQSANCFEPETKDIRTLTVNMYGVKITVIDTPGLELGSGAEAENMRKMDKVEAVFEKMKPDVVFYVDRLDNQGREFQDMEVINAITTGLGEEIWYNAIVVFTHAAVAPPDGSNGQPITYDTYTSQRAHAVQSSIRQATEDGRMMSPVAMVENHPNCRTNRAGEKILPNGVVWRPQLLLLAFASKILNEANEVLKLQEDARGEVDAEDKFGNMMPLLTGLMAEARELKTRKVWHTEKAEKEAQKEHEALRQRIISLEKQIYNIEQGLAKEKEAEDVVDFDGKLAPVYAQRATKEKHLLELKTTLDLEKSRLNKNAFSEAALKRIEQEALAEEREIADRKKKVRYAEDTAQERGSRPERQLAGGMGRGNAFYEDDQGIDQGAIQPPSSANFAIWGTETAAPYDKGGLEPGMLEWSFRRVPPLLDDRLLLEVSGQVQKEPSQVHASTEIKYTYHVSPVVNFRGDIDIDWLNEEGTTFTFTADTSKTDADKPPVAGIALYMAKKKGAAGLKLAKIFTIKKLRSKEEAVGERELRLSAVGGIVRSFEGEVARGLNLGVSTINNKTGEKGKHRLAFNASDFRGDLGFGAQAESDGYNVAGLQLGLKGTMDSSGQGKIGLSFHSEEKMWPAGLILITGLKVLLQRWYQPAMGEF